MALTRALIVAALVFLADRALKVWVVDGLDLPNERVIEVWEPYFALVMAWNRGVNFGLFDFGESGRWVLVGLALALSAGLLYWTRRARGFAMPLGTGLVVGGALGNAWDRVQWGAVADFLNVTCCGIANPYAFNLADVSIFAGVALLILVADRATEPARRGKRDRSPRKKA